MATRKKVVTAYQIKGYKVNNLDQSSTISMTPDDYRLLLKKLDELPLDPERKPSKILTIDGSISSTRALVLLIRRHEEDLVFGHIGYVDKEGHLLNLKKGVVDVHHFDGDERLYWPTHFMWAYADDVMLVEYNKFGPRVGSLRNYLLKITEDAIEQLQLENITMRVLINEDAYKKLLHAGPIAKVEMAVHADTVQKLREANADRDIVAASETLRNLDPEAKVLELVLKRQPYARKGGMVLFKSKLEGLFSILEYFKKMRISAEPRQEDGKTFEIDLLSEKVSYRINVAYDEGKRMLKEDDFFRKMKELYLQNLKPST